MTLGSEEVTRHMFVRPMTFVETLTGRKIGAGTLLSKAQKATKAFEPLTIRGITFQNRIWVSPMCQYSYDDGMLNDWALISLGSYAARGASLTFVEATAVAPEGRITKWDAGLWKDSQMDGLRRITDFIHSQNQKLGIQIAHAGRKASTLPPWVPGNLHTIEDGGFEVVAPSAIKHDDNYPNPKELTVSEIKRIIDDFKQCALRAVKAGVDVVEIHGAHGYLVNEFLSPVSNKRTDEYGGSFENRIRFCVEVVKAVKSVLPDNVLLFIRVSASDRLEHKNEGTTVKDTIKLLRILKALGLDHVDVSSGGVSPDQKLSAGPSFQAGYAYEIKKAIPDLSVNAVGMINTKKAVEEAFDHNLDAVMVGRAFLQNSAFIYQLAAEYDANVSWPDQIGYTTKNLNIWKQLYN